MTTNNRVLKALALLVSILALTMVLAACTSDDPDPTPTSAPDTQAPAATPTPSDTGDGSAPAPTPTAMMMEEEAPYGGIPNFSTRADPPLGWDVSRSGTISILMPGGSIFGMGNMIKQCWDDGASICPGLATEWSSNDERTSWTFNLRDNVYWHDGVQLTASGVKFWLDLMVFGVTVGQDARRPANWDFVPWVESVEAPDDLTVVINLKSPVFDFDQLLAIDNQIIQHPQHLMEPEIQAGNVNVTPLDIGLIGLGPFYLEEYRPGSVIKVRRFDQYYLSDENGNQLPYLDGIDFYITPDQSGMDTAFRTGRLDATARGGGFQLTPEREAAILSSFSPGEVTILEMGQSSFIPLAFNSIRESPVKDVRVRRAIHLWLDREELIQVTFGGFAKRVGMFDPDTAWATPGLMDTPGWSTETKAADREQAKALLAEAGYPDGFDLEYMCRRLWVHMCEPVAGQLEALGISVDLQLVDDATRASRILEGAYDMQHGGATVAVPSEYYSTIASVSTNTAAESKHDDPKVDEFFVRLAAAPTIEERIEIAREMEQYFAVENVYSAPLYTENTHTVVRDYVRGIQVPVDNYRRNLDFATVWLDQ